MTADHLALLTGLFGIPGLLLWLGHGLRRRSTRARRVFWGAVAGHSLALLLTLGAVLFPPVHWEGGARWRHAAIHWSMLLGGLLGAAPAALRQTARSTVRPRPALRHRAGRGPTTGPTTPSAS